MRDDDIKRGGDGVPDEQDGKTEGRIGNSREDLDRACQERGNGQGNGKRPPNQSRQLIEYKDQAERDQHMLEMALLIHFPQHADLKKQADNSRSRHRGFAAPASEPVSETIAAPMTTAGDFNAPLPQFSSPPPLPCPGAITTGSCCLQAPEIWARLFGLRRSSAGRDLLVPPSYTCHV